MGPSARRRALLAAVAVPVAAALGLACWRLQGSRGLAGWAAGAGIGATISVVGAILRARARAMRGPAVTSALLIAVFSTFGLFGAAAIAIALAAPALAPAALLTALGIYLTASFLDAWEARR